MLDTLFHPFVLNDTLTLKNRILMAPLTRCMADDNLVPTQAMIDYYARRADTGLIISEAILIRADGQGYPHTPGLFTPEQINGWRKVTDAVHNNGGKIFAQLWHTGRVAHPFFFNGEYVLAPSAIALEGTLPRMRELTYTVPKPATKTEIEQLIADFSQAAANAIDAGFDGVEIHGANGYLIDQFLHFSTNERDDEFGETPENMARFPLAVIDAISQRIGRDRTGLRLSPGGYFNLEGDARDRKVFDYLLPEVEKRCLAYLHVGIFDDSMNFDYLDGSVSQYMRAHYQRTLVGVGCYSPQTGSDAIEAGKFDLLAIGRPLIANPDYVNKIQSGKALTPYDDTMLAQLI
ncbi:alkene reductase [Photobacterium carnosum]|uniref:Alkene reductase n=1 Tax=Photobacterium carnosum TaxID=2023717 RepID=A0A2N4UUX7_9GAMM|nr:alkene reductase [Photobacterium carnosum]KAE8177543.1 alkene reductase [Photobacterium carnosum]MBY3787461.1 alkene reductase [Photobacterium carnosum]MCD9525379.1 alkene reductase [Photobacterium carnosum]MCD9532093.1 alkene reductase [Photobacterium carnosum]PLC58829.1 alkene reductase [Photobacterium carnosum]